MEINIKKLEITVTKVRTAWPRKCFSISEQDQRFFSGLKFPVLWPIQPPKNGYRKLHRSR